MLIYADLYEDAGKAVMEDIANAPEEAGRDAGRMHVLREQQDGVKSVTVRCVICTTSGDETLLVCSAVAKMDTPDILLCFIQHALWDGCKKYASLIHARIKHFILFVHQKEHNIASIKLRPDNDYLALRCQPTPCDLAHVILDCRRGMEGGCVQVHADA